MVHTAHEEYPSALCSGEKSIVFKDLHQRPPNYDVMNMSIG